MKTQKRAEKNIWASWYGEDCFWNYYWLINCKRVYCEKSKKKSVNFVQTEAKRKVIHCFKRNSWNEDTKIFLANCFICFDLRISKVQWNIRIILFSDFFYAAWDHYVFFSRIFSHLIYTFLLYDIANGMKWIFIMNFFCWNELDRKTIFTPFCLNVWYIQRTKSCCELAWEMRDKNKLKKVYIYIYNIYILYSMLSWNIGIGQYMCAARTQYVSIYSIEAK